MQSWTMCLLMLMGLGSCTEPLVSTEYRDVLVVRRRTGETTPLMHLNVRIEAVEGATVYTYWNERGVLPWQKRFTYFDDGRLYANTTLLDSTSRWGPDEAPLLEYDWPMPPADGRVGYLFSPTYGIVWCKARDWNVVSMLDASSFADSAAFRAAFPMNDSSGLVEHLRLSRFIPPPLPPMDRD